MSETRLLGLLADDLAFGISALRNALHRTHLAPALNCAGDAIIAFKFSGVITSWNKAAEDLFGHTAAEAIGSPIKIVVPPDLTEEFEMLFARFQRGEAVENFDAIRLTKNGRRIPVSLTVRRIEGALRRGVAVTAILPIANRPRLHCAVPPTGSAISSRQAWIRW